MECKLCRQDKKLIESHIVPRKMYEHMRRENKSPIILSDKDNVYPKRSNTGEYDTEIVCSECEATFSPWDDYANDLLLSDYEPENYFIGKDETKLAYIFKNTNYEKLKLFFLSVLWRASVSKRDMFSRINLGPHEQIIKEMILNSDPGKPEDYSVFAARYTDELGQNTMMDPHNQKFDNINYCQMYMAGYIIYIKVDKRNAPKPHSEVSLKDDNRFVVLLRDLTKSKELSIVHTILKKNGY